MTKVKLLIFGSKGWIGNQFLDYLKELNNPEINYIETNVRADNELLVNDILMLHNPTHIISFIGRTYGEGFNTIDYLEQEGKLKENVRDNLYAPLVLANLANKYNIHYTYLGTGCIFSQENPESKLYNENDVPDFFGSSYSTVKGFTDRLMRFYSNVLNLRIRMPIVDFHHSRNFITKITEYDKICSIPNSMTVLTDFYSIILDMIINSQTGTINLVNPGLISHNEILEMYKEIVDPSFKWNNFTIEEQNKILKSKRSNNYLDTSRLEKLYPSVLPIKESVRNCLLRMKHKREQQKTET
jgi:dTDP-4-dehydrorhamnose reductase